MSLGGLLLDGALAASAGAVLLAGWLIGATGIGGVLVVPALVSLQGLAASQAIAASALAFAFPGLAAIAFARRGPGTRDAPAFPLLTLVLAAVPGALAGAWMVHRLQAGWLLGGVAALALVSGLRGLRPARPGAAAAGPVPLGLAAAALLGLAVGLGSGLTGTGGPVLLIPLLLLLRQPLLSAVLAAQLIQLPVALAASLSHWQAGRLDLRLAVLLGLLLLAGSLVGQWAGRRLPTRHLQAVVSVLLLATGLWLGWQALS